MNRTDIVSHAAQRRSVPRILLDELVSEAVHKNEKQLVGSHLHAEGRGGLSGRTGQGGVDRRKAPRDDVRDERVAHTGEVGAGQM